MEQQIAVEQGSAKTRDFGAALLLIIPIATALVCINIVGNWGVWGWERKLLACGLCVQLVIVPLSKIFMENTWAKRAQTAGKSDLYIAYIWLIGATMLFSRF